MAHQSHANSLHLKPTQSPPGLQTDRWFNLLSYEGIWQLCYKEYYSSRNKHAHPFKKTLLMPIKILHRQKKEFYLGMNLFMIA